MMVQAAVRFRSDQKRGPLLDGEQHSLVSQEHNAFAAFAPVTLRGKKAHSSGNGSWRRTRGWRKWAPLLCLQVLACLLVWQWIPKSPSLPLNGRTGAAAQQFERRRGDITCIAEVTSSWPRSESLEEAMSLCLETPGCTATFRQVVSGRTLLCRSHKRAGWLGRVNPLRFLWRAALLGPCQLHSPKLVKLHAASRAVSICAGVGLADFHLQFSPLPCTQLHRYRTPFLHAAASDCAERTECVSFARQAESGDTVLCSAAGESTEWLGASGRFSWMYGCRAGVAGCTGGEFSPVRMKLAARSALTAAAVAGGSFEVKGNAICSPQQVLGNGHTHSAAMAAALCAAEPHCSLYTRRSDTGETWLCQGYVNLQQSGKRKGGEWLSFTTGIQRGCELYAGDAAVSDLWGFKFPNCYRGNDDGGAGGGRCEEGLFPVPKVSRAASFVLPPPLLCDECGDHGLCPVVEKAEEDHTLVDANAISEVLAEHSRVHLEKVGFKVWEELPVTGAINPCVFRSVDGQLSIVYRATTATRCGCTSVNGDYELDQPRRRSYTSRIGMCNLRVPPDCPTCQLIVTGCTMLEDITEIDNLDPDTAIHRKSFIGAEDPRAFVYQGNLYVLASIGVAIVPPPTDIYKATHHRRRVILLALSPTLRVRRALLVTTPATAFYAENKNFVPLVGGDGPLVLVYSVFPLRTCTLDILTGECAAIQMVNGDGAKAGQAVEQVGRLRGSTPLVATPHGYLGLVHHKQDMELGRIYTHKWLLLSREAPHPPLWLSEPFRLPLTGRVPSEDIQFAAGLVVDMQAGTATVSYGVADCFPWFATIPLPLSEIIAAAANEGAPALQPIRPIPPLPLPAQPLSPQIRVRWDAPFSDVSGFAVASRGFARQMVADPGVELFVRDLSQGERFDPDAFADIYSRIIRNQSAVAQDPDVTIRIHWPPNFQPPPRGRLVMYLPWEFEAVPALWVKMLNEWAAEVWVPARFLVDVFARSGVLPEKLHVVGHGAPAEACASPPVAASRSVLQGPKPFRMLFHGGALWRKGLDLLLQAWELAFDPSNGVELIIHCQYGDKDVFNYIDSQLQRLSPHVAPIRFIREKLSAKELNELFARVDVVIHSSRSEGFGLGILAAMARGVPVILPEYGPPTEFVSNSTGFLFPATTALCTKPPCAPDAMAVFTRDWETAQPLQWGDYAPASLAAAMQYAHAHPDEVLERGAAARAHVCRELSWKKVYASMRERLVALSAE